MDKIVICADYMVSNITSEMNQHTTVHGHIATSYADCCWLETFVSILTKLSQCPLFGGRRGVVISEIILCLFIP